MAIETLRILLLVLLAVPLAAAAVVALLGARRGEAVRRVSLAATLVDLLLAVILAANYAAMPRAEGQPLTFRPEVVPGASAADPHATTWDIVPFGPGSAQFYLGLDGLNVWLVLLTAVLMVSAVLISWTAVQERVNEYYAWLLALG